MAFAALGAKRFNEHGPRKVKIVTSFSTLMQKAHALGQARKSGNVQAIEEAQQAHDAYVEMVRKSDQMALHSTVGSVDNPKPSMRP
jgi:hypothetical protein